MTDVRIPVHRDEMDEAIYEWDKAIDDLRDTMIDFLRCETMFKSWEAAQKLAYIRMEKMSATMAESQVRSKPDWVTKMIELNEASVALEEKKRLARLAEAKWETARSRQVTLRALK